MKKIWKIALLSTLALVLTACGSDTNNGENIDNSNTNNIENNQNEVVNSNSDHASTNKLVATKTEEDSITGEKYESTTEITFDENGKAALIVATQVFEKQETADQTYALMSLITSMSEGEEGPDIKVSQDGTKIVTEIPTSLSGTTFDIGDSEIPANEATIEDVRKSLELENWTIQE